MKTLYIIRHAKSSWTFDMEDINRPLGTRGRRDAPRIAKYLSDNERTPQLIISSPASRALYTALFIADEWGYPEEDIMLDSDLYHASAKDILMILSKIGNNVGSVAIFGHNPGFTDLVNHFSTEYLDNLPTAGVFAIEVDTNSWGELSISKSSRKFLISPKRLR